MLPYGARLSCTRCGIRIQQGVRRVATNGIEKPSRPGPDAKPPATLSSSTAHGRALEARSLLRALLRECSYLPEQYVRQLVKVRIRETFRSHNASVRRTQEGALYRERLSKKLKDGRLALSQLQRAAVGDQWAMERVLMVAYGRVGKRRRELLQPLLPSSLKLGPGEASEMQTTVHHVQRTNASEHSPTFGQETGLGEPSKSTQRTRSATTKFEPHAFTAQLRDLLESQMRYAPPPLTRPNPRRLEPSIPELNSWLRPMPQKRVKNMKKGQYARLLDRALPPLPQKEWEDLRDLACGKVNTELAKPRRTRALSDLRDQQTEQDALDIAVHFGKVPQRFSKPSPTGALNHRTMQRLYAKVFSQCPLMQYDDAKAEWLVTWGEQAMLERCRQEEGWTRPCYSLDAFEGVS